MSLKIREEKFDLMVASNTYVIHEGGKSRFDSKVNTDIKKARKLLISKWGEDLSKYNIN